MSSTSKIFVVSTRPPTFPLSGGMAPAVKRACEEFDDVVWYAVGDIDAMSSDFKSATEHSPKQRIRESSAIEGIVVKQIMVDGDKWDGHYNKASNSEIWPICHDRYDLAANLQTMDFYGTMRVNDILAKAIAKDLEGDTETPIWIHDYHHFPLPAFLREHGVQNPIVFFNHIPLPDPEMMKDRSVETQGNFTGLLRGLLSCSAVNFQTAETARRFMQYMGVENPPALGAYDMAEVTIATNHHTETLEVGHFPISIDTAKIMATSNGALATNSAIELAQNMVAKNIFINFERCDYSKGIKPRLLAFEKLLTRHPELAGEVQIVIGAEPTRGDIEEYRLYAEEVKAIINRINDNKAWNSGAQPPVLLLPKHVDHGDVLKLMRNGDDGQRKIGTVTPHRDGMNLVAKEFVAAQSASNAGVLILSEGAGASAELHMGGKGAISYNPNSKTVAPDDNIEPIYAAMLQAVEMSQDEANERCALMQTHLKTFDIGLWADQHKVLMTRLPSRAPAPSANVASTPAAAPAAP